MSASPVSRWEGVWYHGDWAKVDEAGLWYLYGRSDDTLKIAGLRTGPAEIDSLILRGPKALPLRVAT